MSAKSESLDSSVGPQISGSNVEAIKNTAMIMSPKSIVIDKQQTVRPDGSSTENVLIFVGFDESQIKMKAIYVLIPGTQRLQNLFIDAEIERQVGEIDLTNSSASVSKETVAAKLSCRPGS